MISEMESGTLPLEDSLQHYEQGVLLLGALEKELAQVRQRLTILRTQADGTMTEESVEDEA